MRSLVDFAPRDNGWGIKLWRWASHSRGIGSERKIAPGHPIPDFYEADALMVDLESDVCGLIAGRVGGSIEGDDGFGVETASFRRRREDARDSICSGIDESSADSRTADIEEKIFDKFMRMSCDFWGR